jgi:hypothetical protein
MYNDQASMAKPTQIENPKKQDAINQLTERFISDFPPYEAAEILKAVTGNLKQYHQKQIELAKQRVEQMTKEVDPLINL